MKIYSVNDKYGFWCPAGRNLFFQFPKLSFITIKDESELPTDYFSINESTSPKEVLQAVLKTSKRNVYVHISEKNQSKITSIINNFIVSDLSDYLSRYGKYIAGNVGNCPTVELFYEIVIGVFNNPKLQRDLLQKVLQSESSILAYTTIRPLDSYDDFEDKNINVFEKD